MLISRVGDDNGETATAAGDGHDYEYQTANELFDLMTRNHHFDADGNALTTQELVLLYQNIDIGTRLMNDAQRRKPNQHVETVVYNEPDSDTESDMSIEDITNMLNINNERIDMMDNISLDNILCHKLGGLEISSNLTEYDRILFKDPFIKEQLQKLNIAELNSFNNNSLLPTSLLDYICCKRLEDNYNFYIDNIIRYVKHTIEQLKRISNGDYLTDRTKEKWKEVNATVDKENTKVLATSASIPLHVECRNKNIDATWDDIVRSEIDIRSLSKILEKKIVLEIPKLVCGSYRVFSKQCDDNLIISCKREKEKNDEDQSRVDVVLKLQKSQTGRVISNISSIIILKATQALPELPASKTLTPKILPIAYKEQAEKNIDSDRTINCIKATSNDDKNVETTINNETNIQCTNKYEQLGHMQPNIEEGKEIEYDNSSIFEVQKIDMSFSPTVTEIKLTSSNSTNMNSGSEECFVSDSSFSPSNPSNSLKNLLEKPNLKQEAVFSIPHDELRLTIQRLNMQSALEEESGDDYSSPSRQRRSPNRNRIKSPYENNSLKLEEKKRKKLLEIRDKRERKKKALKEKCKIIKHKDKAAMPQASSSVTALSITNKSFYNSIYGQNIPGANLSPTRRKIRKDKMAFDFSIDQLQDECETSEETPENSQKYINRSFYLDEAETEIMYMKMKLENKEESTCPLSTSESNENISVNILSQFIGTSLTDIETNISTDTKPILVNSCDEPNKNSPSPKNVPVTINKKPAKKVEIKVPDTPKQVSRAIDTNDKSTTASVECRKSIDKLYKLMRKREVRKTISKHSVTDPSTSKGSDSGTSLKHRMDSSNTSNLSSQKPNSNKSTNSNPESEAKVLIGSKPQSPEFEMNKNDKSVRRITSPIKSIPDDPLKTISQLLQEFENVQKSRQKLQDKNKPIDSRSHKKDIPNDARTNRTINGRSRMEQHMNTKEAFTRDRKSKPVEPIKEQRKPLAQFTVKDKNLSQKKFTDIIDEAKEARGEAVRGPKLSARLDSLAQPKKCYVMATIAEYQKKYGRNLMEDRLHRLAVERNQVGNPRCRPRRVGPEAASSIPVKPSPSPAQPSGSRSPSSRVKPSPHNSPKSRSPEHPKRNVSNTTGARDKTVAVESIVKTHYEMLPSPPVPKFRVPLAQNGTTELVSSLSSLSIKDATELGAKLNSFESVITAPFSTDTECQESLSSNLCEASLSSAEAKLIDSDFSIDILEDKDVKTAVQNVEYFFNKGEGSVSNAKFPRSSKKDNSKTELEKLETALYNQLSGAFQKRLRIKNLTITPKQSLQQVFLLQSGDAGSLLMKSLTKMHINDCNSQSLHELRSKNSLIKTTSHLKLDFLQLPMQVATVGFAFPQYNKSITTQAPSMNDIGTKKHSISICTKKSSQDTEIYQEPQAHVSKVKIEEIEDCTCGDELKNTSDNACVQETASNNVKARTELSQNLMPLAKTTENIFPGDKTTSVEVRQTYDIDLKVIDKTTPPEFTTSLDVLVGLLNEIQKITGDDEVNNCPVLNTVMPDIEIKQKKTCDIISTSPNHFKTLGPAPNVYRLVYKDENLNRFKDMDTNTKPITIDREVNVNFEKELVTLISNTPSNYFPRATNRSTNVTNSLIGVISEPSSQFSIESLYTHKLCKAQSVGQITEIVTINEKPKSGVKLTALDDDCVQTVKSIPTPENVASVRIYEQNLKRKLSAHSDYDPLMNIKRDILVTMYSILVITVFAALSFPELLILHG